MMLPAVTSCPPKVFTPSRLDLLSRPLRELPIPFLCATLRHLALDLLLLFFLFFLGPPGSRKRDLLDAYLRKLLAMADHALVALLGVVLEGLNLRSPRLVHDYGVDLAFPAVEHLILIADQERLELHFVADLAGKPLYQKLGPLVSAVLLSAGLNYGIQKYAPPDGDGSSYQLAWFGVNEDKCLQAKKRPG